ncbi:MAG: helix-turn-helix transcriptional regulator [Prolixibacteraceae bacterium]|nr:helix-turn-helix transcriptional regulator [Prolixibacteraceae bacterium]
MKNSKLNQFVRQKRKLLGLTQEELSFKAGVGLRFIRELERGKPTLQIDKVNQVLKLFGYELGPVELDRNSTTNEES